MEDVRCINLRLLLNIRLEELYELWDEIGYSEDVQRDRGQVVEDHFNMLLERMIVEEKGRKKRLVDSLDFSVKQCVKLSRKLGVSYKEPDSNQTLVILEDVMRRMMKRLERLKDAQKAEIARLRRSDKELCRRLGMDYYYISGCSVPGSIQIEGLKEHICSLEEEKLTRLQQFVDLKDNLLNLYIELEEEPESDFEREVACEDTERFVLSTANIALVGDIVKRLEKKVSDNKILVTEAVDKLDTLYEHLHLDLEEKFQFLANNQGHSPSVIYKMYKELDRLEQIMEVNVKLWDECFLTPLKGNCFSPSQTIKIINELLEKHDVVEEVTKIKKYFEDNKNIFDKVAERQDLWNKFVELEKQAKDPSRLLNARGTRLLEEEKERNIVSKALPKVDQELDVLLRDWERLHGTRFVVGGVTLKDLIEEHKKDHLRKLEAEKQERTILKNKKLQLELEFGAKPSTPVRRRQINVSKMTPKRQHGVPRRRSNICQFNTVLTNMRKPKVGRITKRNSSGLDKGSVTKNKKVLDLVASDVGININKSTLLVDKFAVSEHDSIVRMDVDRSKNDERMEEERNGKEGSKDSSMFNYSNFKEGTFLSSTKDSMSESRDNLNLPSMSVTLVTSLRSPSVISMKSPRSPSVTSMKSPRSPSVTSMKSPRSPSVTPITKLKVNNG